MFCSLKKKAIKNKQTKTAVTRPPHIHETLVVGGCIFSVFLVVFNTVVLILIVVLDICMAGGRILLVFIVVLITVVPTVVLRISMDSAQALDARMGCGRLM